jgi:transcriptional regulator with XRE-family HTH domain
MPERELAICRRLLDFRLSKKISRAVFARELGINRSRLNNYERGATPLRYAIAAKICETFTLSQEWLATGNGKESDYTLFSLPIQARIAPRMLFSKAYDDYLEPELRNQLSDSGTSAFASALAATELSDIQVNLVKSIGLTTGDQIRAAFAAGFKKILDSLPPNQVWPFWRHIMAAGEQFDAEYGEESKKNQLTCVDVSVNMSVVKSQLKALLADINRITQEPGKKTKLAEFLGAPLASVSRWLSGDREPGGETALRMRYWANHPELH